MKTFYLLIILFSFLTHTFLYASIFNADILSLHPTQFVYGRRAVDQKKIEISALSPEAFNKRQQELYAPVVRGPDHILYLIDRHHEAIALYEINKPTIFVELKADYSSMNPPMTIQEFWKEMSSKHWTYLKDNTGTPQDPLLLPRTVADMKDDPFRSLASEVRWQGGFKKSPIPFAEFYWADFFRSRISASLSFDDAVKLAMQLTQSIEAKNLPGFICKEAL